MTTTGSNLNGGYYTDTASDVQVDEDNANTTAAQLTCYGLDPNDSSKGLYRVLEVQGVCTTV